METIEFISVAAFIVVIIVEVFAGEF